MTFALRDYQNDLLTACRLGHQEYQSICAEVFTGAGKTVAFTRYAADWRESASELHRSMVIAPQITLIGQAAKKIFKETGVMPAIEQGDNFSNETEWARQDFIVASKQSLASNKRYKKFRDIGLVVVDECHYAATESYAEILNYFMDRGAKVLGLSATIKRHDKRAIGQLFAECCYQYGIQEAIPDGWLVPLRVKCKQLLKLDLARVQSTNTQFGKDFNAKQLSEKLENPEVIYEIAEAVNEETRGKKTAIFCASVEEARAVAELLKDQYNIDAGWICADTSKVSTAERIERLNSFQQPDGMTHLANVGILTTGWDFPGLECLVVARPTKSLPLYTQILGRITRPLEGVVDFEGSAPDTRRERIAASSKPHGLVIDLVDNSLEHKLQTAADVLGGRWELANASENDNVAVCRWCLQEFANRNQLAVHVTEKHPEEAEAAQVKDAEELRAEDDAAHQLLRQQRARLRGQAHFIDQQVNPFGGKSYRTAKPSRKVMASDKQRRYLWVLGFKDIDKHTVTKAQASRIIGQLRGGATMTDVRRTNRLVRS